MAEAIGIVIILLCLVSAAVVGVRIYVRVIRAKDFHLELPLVMALCFQISLVVIDFKELELLPHLDNKNNVAELSKLFFVATFLYFGALWSVKVSVNLLHIRITKKIPEVHVWAVRSLYMIVISWLVMYLTTFLGCIPFTRKWEAPLGKAKPCPELKKEWDFWFHIAVNIGTDIWLCILPFSALVRITERRVRIAVFSVYGLAGITITVSIIRAVLLGTSPGTFIKAIKVLSVIEVATAIIVGSLPCISSTFTRKYVHSNSEGSYPMGSDGGIDAFCNRHNFAQLGATELSEDTTPSMPALRCHGTLT